MRQLSLPAGVAILLLAGCASVQEKAGIEQVGNEVHQRIGRQVLWNQGTEDDRRVTQELDRLLQGELTSDAATQVALLNNRRLQASFEELGIAQADLVQAGLLSNPIFAISARYPSGGGGTDLELSITQQFLELITLPMRKKVAKAHFAQVQAQVAEAAVDLATQTRQAYIELQLAQQMLEMRRTVALAAQLSEQAARKLREAGNVRQLDLDTQLAAAMQTELDVTEGQKELVAARERLARLMGLQTWPATATISTRMLEVPQEQLDPAALEQQALDRRLDLVAARHEAQAAAESLGIAKAQIWLEGSSVGVDSERDTGGTLVVGPQAAVPIPLFDQGQASRARVSAQLRQMRQNYLALKTEIRSEIRENLARLAAAASRVERYQHSILPLRSRITQQMQLQYNAMQVSVFQLLEARQQEVMAGQAYLESLRDYWVTRSNMEKTVGRAIPLPERVPAASMPATMPAGGAGGEMDHSMHMQMEK